MQWPILRERTAIEIILLFRNEAEFIAVVISIYKQGNINKAPLPQPMFCLPNGFLFGFILTRQQ